ncbi:MAG: transcription termination factor Rho [Bacteroidaceae bacterium]|nr:transcription termination factor Rho [Bacteroidaceae bacterium]
MHTKSELESMAFEELASLAKELGVAAKSNDEKIDLIYAIIGAESDQAMAAPAEATPKKRGRKSKAEKEAAAAASATAKEAAAEPAAAKAAGDAAQPDKAPAAKKGRKAKAAAATETASAAAAAAAADGEAVASSSAATDAAAAPAKRRGRKSKAEKAAEAAAQEMLQFEAPAADGDAVTASVAEEAPAVVPETADAMSAAPSVVAPQETDPAAAVVGKPTPEQVKAFFDADEPDFIILHDVPVIDLAQPVPAAPMEAPEAQTKEPAFLQKLANVHTQAAPAAETSVAASRAKGAARFDFSNLIQTEGVLEVMPEGIGLLRSSDYNYLPSPDDVFVNQQFIRQYALKTGDVVEGSVRPPRDNEKYFILTSVKNVNGCDPATLRDRQSFEHLTPLFADEKFTLCRGYNDPTSVRIVDLFSPIGKGQRALIVAQPKTGKTILMKEIANAIAANHPEAYLMMLLIDERPEEVTDMARTVNAEVIASTFDEPADHHVKIAGIVLEKAKRMVECGHDVVIFLDSITRLARAYNNVAPGSGKILTGGVDANALQRPKRFFGAARNIEGGGSLTIIATALIDTGSRMDEVIFEEFKGTGNMELQLDRTLANKRIFPAVNIVASSTRRDDLLHDKMTLQRMWVLRNYLADMNPIEAMTDLKKRLEDTKTNEEFLISMNS